MLLGTILIVLIIHKSVALPLIYNKTSNMFVSKNRINSNITLPIWGGDLVFDISGEIDDASALKSIMLFRRYY